MLDGGSSTLGYQPEAVNPHTRQDEYHALSGYTVKAYDDGTKAKPPSWKLEGFRNRWLEHLSTEAMAVTPILPDITRRLHNQEMKNQ